VSWSIALPTSCVVKFWMVLKVCIERKSILALISKGFVAIFVSTCVKLFPYYHFVKCHLHEVYGPWIIITWTFLTLMWKRTTRQSFQSNNKCICFPICLMSTICLKRSELVSFTINAYKKMWHSKLFNIIINLVIVFCAIERYLVC
jgi:hypothetical protein